MPTALGGHGPETLEDRIMSTQNRRHATLSIYKCEIRVCPGLEEIAIELSPGLRNLRRRNLWLGVGSCHSVRMGCR